MTAFLQEKKKKVWIGPMGNFFINNLLTKIHKNEFKWLIKAWLFAILDHKELAIFDKNGPIDILIIVGYVPGADNRKNLEQLPHFSLHTIEVRGEEHSLIITHMEGNVCLLSRGRNLWKKKPAGLVEDDGRDF
jgi:hypothetical protein